MSRFNIYPVLYTYETRSGRVVNAVCNENWDKARDELERAKMTKAIKDFRFTTALDRRLRGQKG